MVLDWSQLYSWQWLTLAGAAISVYVFWDVFNLKTDLKHMDNPYVAATASRRAWRLHHFLKLRFMLVIGWIVLAYAHFAVNSPFGENYIPAATLETLRQFFR